ncbi:MAG TPA: class I SAM-dependent RNA methyltransferase [Anaerolineae bacterium]|nr:class I SAM-dependent RNA methyltransferase [Anaerolineae bacterium]
MSITLIATCKYGLEKLVKFELEALDFYDITVHPGRLEFTAELDDIPQLNLWLRCADRLRLKVGEFHATTFDDLYEQTKALPWEQWITADGEFTVIGKSVKSQLMSVRSSQSIVKKAVVDRLQNAYQIEDLPETGPAFTIQISLLKDIALLTIDTSGSGLHKRGYRAAAGDAPLKETLAAALVQLSFWRHGRLLIDPMCGSGTILIEAAMIGRNIPPGLNRSFASEEWPCISDRAWEQARYLAQQAIIPTDPQEKIRIWGYDSNPEEIAIAKHNAEKAGVAADILFEVKDIHKLWIDRQYGIVITNPPYGIRLSDFQEMNQIYITIHKMFRKKSGWSVFVFTADAKFPDYFKRARPDRVRKLYNGTIEANYYQYYGEKPPDTD